ncbi:MAG: histidine phosphatase family protein, partial [Lachnospiraceae bacterium]
MRLFLIRHGRQCSPLCNVDVELSAEGVQQAKLLAARLCTLVPDKVYTSGLLRAKQTAGIIFEKNTEFLVREELNEISFGDLTGKADAENAVTYADYFAAKKRKEENLRIPGGENPSEVFERAIRVVEEALASGAETVVFVTHGGVIRALTAGLLGLGPEQMLRIADGLEHCSLTELHY